MCVKCVCCVSVVGTKWENAPGVVCVAFVEARAVLDYMILHRDLELCSLHCLAELDLLVVFKYHSKIKLTRGDFN